MTSLVKKLNKIYIRRLIHDLFSSTKYIMGSRKTYPQGPDQVEQMIERVNSRYRGIESDNIFIREIIRNIIFDFKTEKSKINDVDKYISSLTAEEFIAFRHNSAYWLLACCRLNMFCVNNTKYHITISMRSSSGVKSLASLAPETLNLYVNYLNGSDETNEIYDVKNVYIELMQNTKLMRSKGKSSRMYLKHYLDADKSVRVTNYSKFISRLEEVEDQIENLYRKRIDSFKNDHVQKVKNLYISCTLAENDAYEKWLLNTSELLYQLIDECYKVGDYQKFIDTYNSIKTYNMSLDYIKDELQSLCNKFPHTLQYVRNGSQNIGDGCDSISQRLTTNAWLKSHPIGFGHYAKALITIECDGSTNSIVATCDCGCNASCILRSCPVFIMNGLTYVKNESVVNFAEKAIRKIENPIENDLYPFKMVDRSGLNFWEAWTYSGILNGENALTHNKDMIFQIPNCLNVLSPTQINLRSVELYDKWMYTNRYNTRPNKRDYNLLRTNIVQQFQMKEVEFIDLLYVLNVNILNDYRPSMRI